MSGIDDLAREHRQIARVYDAFEAFVARIEQGEDVDRQDLARFVTFFREFVDLGHHEKEEGILIPALVEAGLGWDEGLIAGIRRDHDQERYLMRSLRHAAMKRDGWSTEDKRHLVSIARTLIDFGRAHVRMEDEGLFPALRSELTPDVAGEVARRLARFDENWSEHGELGWLRKLASELTAHYSAAASLTGVHLA